MRRRPIASYSDEGVVNAYSKLPQICKFIYYKTFKRFTNASNCLSSDSSSGKTIPARIYVLNSKFLVLYIFFRFCGEPKHIEIFFVVNIRNWSYRYRRHLYAHIARVFAKVEKLHDYLNGLRHKTCYRLCRWANNRLFDQSDNSDYQQTNKKKKQIIIMIYAIICACTRACFEPH